MDTLSGSGLQVDLPDGWDGRIYRRQAEDGVITRRALHAASFALPANRGDYATGAIERMQSGDVLVALIEFDPDSAGSGLFRSEGLPSALSGDDFSPAAMPRAVPGRTGAQYFFSAGGRAFCLFVALGSHADRADLAPVADEVVQTIRIDG